MMSSTRLVDRNPRVAVGSFFALVVLALVGLFALIRIPLGLS